MAAAAGCGARGARLHVALRAQVVQLVGPDGEDEVHEVHGVREVAVVQKEAHAGRVAVLVQPLDAARVEGRGPPDDAVNLVALRGGQLCIERTALEATRRRNTRPARAFSRRSSAR